MKTVHRFANLLHQADRKGLRWLAHHLPRWVLSVPTKEVFAPTIYGFGLHIDPSSDSGLEQSLYYMGSYERGTLHIMHQLLRAGDHFVDVGANIGLMSLFASKCVGNTGKVTSFEPNPETRRILNRNVRDNAVNTIEVQAYALGADSSAAQIYADPDGNRGAASLHTTGGAALAEIEIRSFDSLFFAENATTPQLVKIDVEGYEADVLRGGGRSFSASNAPALIVESSTRRDHSKATERDELFALLKGFGHYRIFKGIKTKAFVSNLVEVNTAEEMPEHDNVYALRKDHCALLNTLI